MQAIDNRVTFGMLVQGLANRLKGIMAKQLSPEEKLNLIKSEMKKDVEQKRITARSIRAKMVALSDPDTKELEPMERLEAHRKKIVAAGAQLMKERDSATEQVVKDDLTKKINRLATDIKSLDSQLGSMHSTYDTLKDAYEVSIENLKTAQSALDHVENNAEGMLFAIKAHQEALNIRDKAKKDNACDASFLSDMEKELNTAKAELSSDKKIDEVLSADRIDLDSITDTNVDVLAEFEAAKK